jgi:methylmalonyl-CoA mutase cobalamin-binding subunit
MGKSLKSRRRANRRAVQEGGSESHEQYAGGRADLQNCASVKQHGVAEYFSRLIVCSEAQFDLLEGGKRGTDTSDP